MFLYFYLNNLYLWKGIENDHGRLSVSIFLEYQSVKIKLPVKMYTLDPYSRVKPFWVNTHLKGLNPLFISVIMIKSLPAIFIKVNSV